jgi:hypothetical protein
MPMMPYGKSKATNKTWHEAFDELTASAAYWVGLLMADGWIEGHRRVGLEVAARDIEIPQAFKRYTDTAANVLTRTRKGVSPSTGQPFISNVASIRVNSAQIVKDLSKWGVVPRKTGREEAVEECAFDPYFWAGIIDGDGHIYWANNHGTIEPRIGLTSSETLCHQFVEYANSLYPCAPTPRPHTKGAYRVQITANAARKMLAVLPLRLSRKRKLAKESP